MKFKMVKIFEKDDLRLTTTIKEIYLKENPEMRGIRLTRAFLIRAVIDYVEKSKGIYTGAQ
jgi:hypothetical protein